MDMKWWNLLGLALSTLIYKEWGVSFSFCLMFAIVVGVFTAQLSRTNISRIIFGGKMARSNQERYWRIYLLLHEGSPLIFTELIAKEIEKCGGDLDSLLIDNKSKLCENLSTLDANILFPESKTTDIDKWNACIFPCVILTLFSKNLQLVEKQLIRRIQNVQDDIEELPAMSLDCDAYDDLEQTLSKTFYKLARCFSNEMEMVTKIDELLKVFLKQPLQFEDLLCKVTKFKIPNKIRQKLTYFLTAHVRETGNKEDGSLDQYGHSRKSANATIDAQKDVEKIPKLKEATRDSGDIPCDSEDEAKNDLEDESSILGSRNIPCDSEDVTKHDIEDVSRLRGSDDVRDDSKDVTKHDLEDESCKLGSDDIPFDSEDVTKHDDLEDVSRIIGSDDVRFDSKDVAKNDLEDESSILGSDDIPCDSEDVTKHDLEDVSRILVQNVEGGLTEQEAESTRLIFQKSDFGESINVKSVDDIANKTLEDWESVNVKVAVLGRTGVGKSRFINAIRGCTSDKDPLYAKVGSIETTAKAECYPHPKNNRLELYDLPGIGTDKFTRKTFIDDERINFHSYDVYIIVFSDRFTEDETFFANQVERSGKKFLFVRSRVDINLDDVSDKQAEITKIRDDCQTKLNGTSMKETDVFLISSKEPYNQLLDFDRLLERLVNSLSGLKKEALMFSLQFNTKKFIDDKEEALKSRALGAGMKSAAGGAVPIPGFSLVCDIVLVQKELDFYRKTLGVTDNDLKDLAEKTKTNVDELKNKYELKSFDVCAKTSMPLIKNPDRQIVSILQTLALSEAVESSVKILPVIGSVIGAGVSFATTTLFLRSNLKIIAEDARKMMEILVKETGIKIMGVK